MDVDDMALIGPGVVFSEVPAIHQKRTLAFVNTFITNTVSILNNLARTSEAKMQKFEEKLQRMDASLCILEANLASIPGLDTLNAKPPPVAQPQQQTQEISQKANDNERTNPEPEEKVEAVPEVKRLVSEPVGDDSTEPDPRYTKFFKMVQFGVPPQAVKLKMMSEGLNPNVLDNPKSVPLVAKAAPSSASSSNEDSD